jgi:hypothetical protein
MTSGRERETTQMELEGRGERGSRGGMEENPRRNS